MSVADLLNATLDPSKRREAEASLRQAEESQPNFSLSLLQLVADESQALSTRLAAALFFKNSIKRNWTDEDGVHKLPAQEVQTIKSELIGLMVKVPPALQAQLGDAISVIAESDFYQKWDTLVDDLVSRLTADDASVNNGVLQVAHSIFKRWRPLYRSDELYTEINHVLSKFGEPFLQLWQRTDAVIEQNRGNKKALETYLGTMDLIVKLFNDLSSQDLPPQFEDHLQPISGLLHKYLTFDDPVLAGDADDEAGSLEHVRAGVFEALVLYTKKYEDAFGPFLTQFIGTSWNFLTTIGPETKYDLLVSRALEFLTTIAGIRQHAESFNNPEVLGQVTEKVVLPNLSLRESDVEMFEDEPIEFIRRDLEGSDDDSRRRAATTFLKKLMEQFEKPVTDVVMRYVNHFLAEYAKDRKANWKAKDTAVHLFSSIAAKGQATAARGVLSVNPNVDVIDFFQSNVAQDLTDDSAEPLLKVGAIKYLYIFRSILSGQQWQAAFPLLVQHLNNSNYVVYTYAAIAVDRALYLKDEQRQAIIPRANIEPLARDLLQHLFKLITANTSPEKIQENEYLMKCVMRVLITLGDGILPVADIALSNLVNITRVIRHNPSNPGFCYFHFEAMGALIRFAGPTQPDKLDAALFPVFGEVLQNEVEDFSPYIFQLFAAMASANPAPQLSPNFRQLLSAILPPKLWESRGNVPALTRLLCELLPRGAAHVAETNQTEAILLIFQRLVALKSYETYAMDLIESVVTSFPPDALASYWQSILQLMLTRLSNSSTENFKMRFVRFYHLVASFPTPPQSLGADFFIGVADRVQENVFTPLYTTIILPDTQKLVRPYDRKTAVVALTRTLTDSQAFETRYAKKGWGWTCEALLKLLINPPLPPAADDTIEDRDMEELGFTSAFTQLNTCKPVAKDAHPEVQDVKAWVSQVLRERDARDGKVGKFVGEKLDAEGQNALQVVMRG